MRFTIDLEMTPRRRRTLLWTCVPAMVLSGAAVAYAQTTTGATMVNDAVIGTALNALGQAVATLQSQVAVLQAADHVARATLTSGGTVVSQTGTWIRQVNHPATGRFVLTFAPMAFVDPPTCVTTPNTSDSPPPLVGCYAVTSSSVTCQTAAGTAPVDVGLSIVCVGR
jgi:hypothetical protein